MVTDGISTIRWYFAMPGSPKLESLAGFDPKETWMLRVLAVPPWEALLNCSARVEYVMCRGGQMLEFSSSDVQFEKGTYYILVR